MSPLPLLLAGALASLDPSPLPALDPSPLPPAGEPSGATIIEPAALPEPPPPAAGQPTVAPVDQWGSVSGGLNLLRFDGIPVKLAAARLGLTSLGPGDDGATRFGFALFFEGAWGETENGLHCGMIVAGPHLVVASGPLRGSLGIEAGATSIRRATDGFTRFLSTGLVRGALEADLWRFQRTSLFATVTGTLGLGGDVPIRGLGVLLGLRF